MKRLLIVLLMTNPAFATSVGNTMPKDEPIEGTESDEAYAQTLPEVLTRLYADPEVFGTFKVCVKGDCAQFAKQNPKPATPAPDAATAVERIAGGLFRATGGRVEISFTYHEKNPDGSERDVTVKISAATGAAASGFDDATGKAHR